jgi:drug/metabolite transporter (DMT)-like permease
LTATVVLLTNAFNNFVLSLAIIIFMTHLELFQAFVAPAIFISAASLLVLTINARLMGIVTRLRTFHKDKHLAALAGKKQEVLVLQAQIKSIENRAMKIKNAYFYCLLGTMGVLATCLLLGLSLYVSQALIVAVLLFVLSILSMLVGMYFFLSEVSISLSSEKEEEQFYDLIDVMLEATEVNSH